MTQRQTIEAKLPRGCTLTRAYNRGRKVWCAVCAQHARGLHRYTLTSGVPCWDWWPTLAAAAERLEAK